LSDRTGSGPNKDLENSRNLRASRPFAWNHRKPLFGPSMAVVSSSVFFSDSSFFFPRTKTRNLLVDRFLEATTFTAALLVNFSSLGALAVKRGPPIYARSRAAILNDDVTPLESGNCVGSPKNRGGLCNLGRDSEARCCRLLGLGGLPDLPETVFVDKWELVNPPTGMDNGSCHPAGNWFL